MGALSFSNAWRFFCLLEKIIVNRSHLLEFHVALGKGAELFSKWPAFQESQKDWKAPRPAVETLTRYFRYCANLKRLNQPTAQVGCIKNADLLAPPSPGGLDYNLNALASLVRDFHGRQLQTLRSIMPAA